MEITCAQVADRRRQKADRHRQPANGLVDVDSAAGATHHDRDIRGPSGVEVGPVVGSQELLSHLHELRAGKHLAERRKLSSYPCNRRGPCLEMQVARAELAGPENEVFKAQVRWVLWWIGCGAGDNAKVPADHRGLDIHDAVPFG